MDLNEHGSRRCPQDDVYDEKKDAMMKIHTALAMAVLDNGTMMNMNRLTTAAAAAAASLHSFVR